MDLQKRKTMQCCVVHDLPTSNNVVRFDRNDEVPRLGAFNENNRPSGTMIEGTLSV